MQSAVSENIEDSAGLHIGRTAQTPRRSADNAECRLPKNIFYIRR